MPAEGLPWLERDEILSFEEIERLVARDGLDRRRLRAPDRRRAAGAARAADAGREAGLIEGLKDLSLTTNGYLLDKLAGELAAAGLKRINVSLDSLARDRFFQITRRDSLPQVLAGLEALDRYPQLKPIKVNCVAMRDFTEQEVIPFAELARRSGYQVRFIEFMPLDADHSWSKDKVLTGAEIRAAIDAVYPLEPAGRDPHATAKVYRFADGQGEIGFINPVSEPFCADCNRIRLTAEGKLRTCLFSLHETDLREPLRNGAERRRADRADPRRGLAQGAQAPRLRARLPPATAYHEPDRRLTAALRYLGLPRARHPARPDDASTTAVPGCAATAAGRRTSRRRSTTTRS